MPTIALARSPRASSSNRALYLEEIKAKKKGIVLMHDGPGDPKDGDNGPTVDMVKYLVPKLKAAGYKFARVDQIPAPKPPPAEPAAASNPSPSPSLPPPAAKPPCGTGG